MAQFSVYRNRSPRTKGAFPLLLDVQSDLLDALTTRVVIPMSRAGSLTKNPLEQLTPMIPFETEIYVLLTPQLAAIAHHELGSAIGSLAEYRGTILAAMDFLLTGI